MERKYEHLSAEERATIMIETERGASLRSIARLLDRSPSTISRELTRGRPCPASRYRAAEAAGRYRQRRRASVRPRKLVEGNWLWQRVRDGLCYRFWSLHQIAARLRFMHPDESERQVSAETIYRAIYAHPRGSLKAEMVAALRQAKPSRGRRRTTAASTGGFVPEQLRIVHRPEDIEHRLMPGVSDGQKARIFDAEGILAVGRRVGLREREWASACRKTVLFRHRNCREMLRAPSRRSCSECQAGRIEYPWFPAVVDTLNCH